MITFIAFLLMILGSVNWLSIGLLQYDFIAGLFGFQASIFSRLIYILFGIGAMYFVIRIIANKGDVKVFERKKSKKEREEMKLQKKKQKEEKQNTFAITPANIEAGKEFEKYETDDRNFLDEKQYNFHETNPRNDFLEIQNHHLEKRFPEEDSLFDEHFSPND